jgi:hypothetical protein
VLGDERQPQRLDVVVADDRHEPRRGAHGARQLAVGGPAQLDARRAARGDLLDQLGGEVTVAEHQDGCGTQGGPLSRA